MGKIKQILQGPKTSITIQPNVIIKGDYLIKYMWELIVHSWNVSKVNIKCSYQSLTRTFEQFQNSAALQAQ